MKAGLIVACLLANTTPVQGQICFRPRSLATCRSFLLTEFAIGATMFAPPPRRSDMYYSGELGWMVNVAARSAIGGAVQYGVDEDSNYRIGVKPRYRRWLTDATSIDVAAGLLLRGDGFAFPGFTGHVAINFAQIAGLGIQIEEYDEPLWAKSGVDVHLMGRVGAQWGVATGVLVAVLGLLVAAASGATS